ncbi:MAG: 50S ribosomal protein L25 [Acidimicrobiales bacterium]|jgi:large subunit ribosomal protein L25
MADITLVVDPVRPSGSRESGRLRAAGRIPAVVYGHGIDPISVSVDAKDLRHALGGEAGSRALLRLVIGDGEHLAMARQLQRHPVRHTVIHVDFQVVRRDEVISAEVPIVLVGEALAVTKNDGTVDQEMTVVSVKAKPADLPPNLEVDVSGLEIGDSIRAGDIVLPPGVELDEDGDSPVVVAHAPRAVVEEAPVVVAEEAEAVAPDAEPSSDAS